MTLGFLWCVLAPIKQGDCSLLANDNKIRVKIFKIFADEYFFDIKDN